MEKLVLTNEEQTKLELMACRTIQHDPGALSGALISLGTPRHQFHLGLSFGLQSQWFQGVAGAMPHFRRSPIPSPINSPSGTVAPRESAGPFRMRATTPSNPVRPVAACIR